MVKPKRLDLSNYGNTMPDFHIHINVGGSFSAKEPHFHNYFQIYFITKGTITHHLLSKESVLSFGDAFIIPPGYPHYISVKSRDAQFYSCSFSREFASPIICNNSYGGNFLINLLNHKPSDILTKISISPEDINHIKNLLSFMLYEYTNRGRQCRENILNSLSSVLTLLERNYKEKLNADIHISFSDKRQSVLFCIEYVKNNFAKNLTLSQMVALSKMQRSEFCKLFRNLSGQTFHTMLNALRIQKSVELIKNSRGKPKLKLISEICGYTNFSTFYRNFVKFMGVTPGEYYETQNTFN